MRKPLPPALHKPRTLKLSPKVAQPLRDSAAMVQHLDRQPMVLPHGRQ